MKINELPWQPHPNHLGDRAVVRFPNGYGASILRGGEPFTYTANGTYELAVLYNGALVYDTPVASDVLANITATEVETALAQIASLSPAPEAMTTIELTTTEIATLYSACASRLGALARHKICDSPDAAELALIASEQKVLRLIREKLSSALPALRESPQGKLIWNK